MKPQRLRPLGTWLVALVAIASSSGCFESDGLRTAGLATDSSVGDTAGSDVSGDVSGDTAQPDVTPEPDATPSGIVGGLVGSGSVASSQNYRMVATIGAPLSDPMAASSTSYRMTTSLLSFSEASQ